MARWRDDRICEGTKPRDRWKNTSGEAAPPHAVVKIINTDPNNKQSLIGVKPNGSTSGATFRLNMRSLVANGKPGTLRTDSYGMWALYDDANTPSPGESWGPGNDWLLHKDGIGFIIVGGAESFTVGMTTYHRVRVMATSQIGVTVYEFENCEDDSRHKYVTNAECADHLDEESELYIYRIAAIKDDDGNVECWRLRGVHEGCRTGDCVEILAWTVTCSNCGANCFLLIPCDPEDEEIVVRGFDQYLGATIHVINEGESIDGCYRVGIPDECVGINEAVTVDDVVAVRNDCQSCRACYEVVSCIDAEDIRYISNDLVDYLGVDAPEDAVGTIFRDAAGLCWEVTAIVLPCDETTEAFELPDEPSLVESCGECCYLFTPCDEESESEPFVARTDPNGEPLEPLVGKVVLLAGGECWTVSRAEDCEGATIGIPTLEEVYDNCLCCHVSRWKECGTESTFIRTRDNLCAYENSDSILKRAEDEKCYEYFDNGGAESIVDFTVEEVYPDCVTCATPRFKLTPACGGSCASNCGEGGGTTPITDEIVTDDDLSAVVGEIIKFEGKCYTVSWTTDEVTHSGICWEGPFRGCAECQESPSLLRVVGYEKASGAFKILEISVAYHKCGELPATDDCPAGEGANAYAAASII